MLDKSFIICFKNQVLSNMTTFRGERVADMTRDELLAVIGWLMVDCERVNRDMMKTAEFFLNKNIGDHAEIS